MTDLLDRLRAVNPVRTCTPPIIEEVWGKLGHEHQGPGDKTPRQHLRCHIRAFSRARPRVRHVGVGLSVAVPVLVAGLALVLLGHNQSRQLPAQTRPPSHRPAPRHPPRPAATPSPIVAALAHGVHPLAPDARMQLPILGSSGSRSLHSFRGKVVILNLFASWCAPCTRETPILEQAQKHIRGRRATVLGVTYLDNPAASRAFVRASHITYPVLRDVTGRFVPSFKGDYVPETFVIDRRGRIVAAHEGELSPRWLIRTLAGVLPG